VVRVFEKQEVLLQEAGGTPVLATNSNSTKLPFAGQVPVYSSSPALQQMR